MGEKHQFRKASPRPDVLNDVDTRPITCSQLIGMRYHKANTEILPTQEIWKGFFFFTEIAWEKAVVHYNLLLIFEPPPQSPQARRDEWQFVGPATTQNLVVKFDGEICGGVLVENASDVFPSKSSKISFQTSPEVRHQFRRRLRQLHSSNRWCLSLLSQVIDNELNAQGHWGRSFCLTVHMEGST